jgi:hypothetical protein
MGLSLSSSNISELERTSAEAIVTSRDVPFQYLRGGMQEITREPQAG